MALTGKKRLFADAVIAGKSNKDAAIAAGYSAKTASAAGSRLVKDPKVVDYLGKARGAGVPAPATTAPPAIEGPKFDLNAALMHTDPKAFLLAAMNDTELEEKLRIDAAKSLLPFMHKKLGEGGKKDGQADAAKAAGAGRFGLRAVK